MNLSVNDSYFTLSCKLQCGVPPHFLCSVEPSLQSVDWLWTPLPLTGSCPYWSKLVEPSQWCGPWLCKLGLVAWFISATLLTLLLGTTGLLGFWDGCPSHAGFGLQSDISDPTNGNKMGAFERVLALWEPNKSSMEGPDNLSHHLWSPMPRFLGISPAIILVASLTILVGGQKTMLLVVAAPVFVPPQQASTGRRDSKDKTSSPPHWSSWKGLDS